MMIRTLAGFGAALALVGSAHAQAPQSTLGSQTAAHASVRPDLYRAAQAACLGGRVTRALRDVTCVDETYQFSLHQLGAGRVRLQQTAMQTRSAPAALR